jgi:hypothetical protein
VLVTVSVLMLAAAAGLGAAALLRSGPQTWRSTSAVQVVPPSSSGGNGLGLALTRAAAHVSYATRTVRDAAGVPGDDVRGDLAGTVAGDRVVITARAGGSSQAELLARTAAEELQQWFAQDQLQEAVVPGERFTTAPAQGPTDAELTEPSSQRLAIAAGVAAGVVLLVALLLRGRARRRARRG